MFRRIVSQLSLSPSAASQLTFYARRLAAEKVTRTFSAIAAVLIVLLQLAVITAPPTPVNASSANDVLFGGIVSRDDLLNRYDENAQGIKPLFSRLGITRADLASTHLTTLNSLDHSLKSLGRIQHRADDQPIDANGATYWLRGLYTWDSGSTLRTGSTYKALVGTRAGGSFFAVLMNCGNIVTRTVPPKPTPTPTPTPSPTPTSAPKPTPAPTPAPKPKSLTCTSLEGTALSGEAPLTTHFTGKGAAAGLTITAYIFDFGDSSSATQASPTITHTYTIPGRFIARLQIQGGTGAVTPPSEACSFTVDVTATPAAFSKHKSAFNLTQNIDATTKPALAGDKIRYTLTTKNVGGTSAHYVVTEHAGDILEYAGITDAGGADLDNQSHVLSWAPTPLDPGKTITKTFVVTIKNPIPATPTGLSDKNSFDLKLDNVYGNAIQITLNPPLPKQIEIAATTLPATGTPAATLIIMTVSAISLFFYFRNRQLIAEVKLLRNDYQGGA